MSQSRRSSVHRVSNGAHLITQASCGTVGCVSAPTYQQLTAAIGAADLSHGVPAEIVHLMEGLHVPHHLQVQIQKLLHAGNSERALKLIEAHRQHEGLWIKLRRKLGV